MTVVAAKVRGTGWPDRERHGTRGGTRKVSIRVVGLVSGRSRDWPDFRAALRTSRATMVMACCFHSIAAAQPNPPTTDLPALMQRVREDNAAYTMLGRLCDDFGGRLTGSAQNRAALQQLAAELRELGLEPELVPFSMPGWERGDDEVRVLAPFERRLRVAAIGYTAPHATFAAELIDLGQARTEDFADRDVRERVALLAAHLPRPIHVIAADAAARGVRGLLVINRENGGQLLARSGGFQGEPLPIPVLSVNREEGQWLERLLARNVNVRLQLTIRSRCVTVDTANLVVRLPGRTADRVVVGAHFDSWDLGQGAIDNGLGVAQLYALARALRGVERRRVIELVWFNGEEQGLWGSRHHAALTRDAPIVAMVNLDMVGVPQAVNALGDDDFVPVLERWQEALGGQRLPGGVLSRNWMASDHTPFQLAGVRAITFHAPIAREAVRYYHDFGDTFDKLTPGLVADSAAVIAALVATLADSDDASLIVRRRSEQDTRALFTRFELESRLRDTGLASW